MIDLTSLKGSVGTARFTDLGVMTQGAVSQRLDRIGSRFSFDFQTIPFNSESEGRRAIALLQQAKQQGGIIAYPQPGLRIGAPGDTLANLAHTGGTTLNLKSGTPNYTVRMGQALSIVKGTRRYLHFSAAETIFNDSGQGVVTLTTPMRVHLAGDEVVEIAKPKMEGWIEGDELQWTIEASRLVGLSFTIRERA